MSLTKENSDPSTKSYFIRCSCYGHLLNVVVFTDDSDLLYLSFYGYDYKLSFWNRIREAWKILWRGRGDGDEIVLYRAEALELGKTITELAAVMVEEEK